MSAEMIGVIGIVALIVLLFLRVWVGAAMAIVGFIGLLAMRDFGQAFSIMGSTGFNQLNSYTMTAIPMFALMGMVISETDMGKNLYLATHRLIGRFRGGLASATIAAAGLLGAICGSENIATVIMTKISYPEMKSLNYDDRLSCAAIACGAPLAIIIPPSMPMILYSILTENSVGALFIGGIVPGVILTVVFIITVSAVCAVKPDYGPRGKSYNLKDTVSGLTGILPVILLFALVLGSIYFGICTTTEAGAMGAIGSIVIAFFTRQLQGRNIKRILFESANTLGLVMLMLIGIYIFVQFIALSKVPFALVKFVAGLDVNRNVILLMILLMYFILGMLLPQLTIIILTVPIIYPVILSLGCDPIWFGVLVVMMQAIGGITPPVGMVVFMVSGMSGVPIPRIFQGILPFIATNVAVLLLVLFIPQLVTWLPTTMM